MKNKAGTGRQSTKTNKGVDKKGDKII